MDNLDRLLKKWKNCLRPVWNWQVRLREHLRFDHCLRNEKVYFGGRFAARQGNPRRHFYMDLLVKGELTQKPADYVYRILEIGSWAGGSAITFAKALKTYHNSVGKVVCVDPWEDYLDIDRNKGEVYRNMKKALKNNNILQLFLHNVKYSQCHNIVTTFKGYSHDILPLLKEMMFDLIYIDGDHSYIGVSYDIIHCLPLLKVGGIICGDDLELQYHEVNLRLLQEMKDVDYVLDPGKGEYFHPGVSLAVYEIFTGEVSSWEGFWAMRKTEKSWEKVDLELEGEALVVPPHLR